jgi:dipeptidyl-peptidase-4
MLFATNPRTVMIRKTANDYWVLDKAAASWHKLGGKTNSGLLYAKLSPDGMHAAYVRECNIYVEDVRSGAVNQLTRDGSENIINGTSDWVNEEELSIRDAFEWSPTGGGLRFFNSTKATFPTTLINYTDSLYPALTSIIIPNQARQIQRCALRLERVGRPGALDESVRRSAEHLCGGWMGKSEKSFCSNLIGCKTRTTCGWRVQSLARG